MDIKSRLKSGSYHQRLAFQKLPQCGFDYVGQRRNNAGYDRAVYLLSLYIMEFKYGFQQYRILQLRFIDICRKPLGKDYLILLAETACNDIGISHIYRKYHISGLLSYELCLNVFIILITTGDRTTSMISSIKKLNPIQATIMKRKTLVYPAAFP